MSSYDRRIDDGYRRGRHQYWKFDRSSTSTSMNCRTSHIYHRRMLLWTITMRFTLKSTALMEFYRVHHLYTTVTSSLRSMNCQFVSCVNKLMNGDAVYQLGMYCNIGGVPQVREEIWLKMELVGEIIYLLVSLTPFFSWNVVDISACSKTLVDH